MGFPAGPFAFAELLLLTVAVLQSKYCVFANVNMFPSSGQQQFVGRDASWEAFSMDTDEVFPVAYYDINADKLTDVIAVSRDRSSINIFLAYTEPPYLRRAFNSQSIIPPGAEKRIVSVRPGDFTGNGMGDLMITLGKDDDFDGNRTNVDLVFCLVKFTNGRDHPDLQCGGPGSGAKISNLVQEPMVLDLNGDMVMDLLGEKWASDPTSEGMAKKRMIWLSENTRDSFEWKNQAFHVIGEVTEIRSMTYMSSNAYADLDGDNVPELSILSEDPAQREKAVYYLETFELVKDSSRQVAFRYKTPPESIETVPSRQTKVMGQPIVVDFEHSGRLSHLVPYCTDFRCENSGIYVIEGGQALPLPLGPMMHDGIKFSFIPPQEPPKNSAQESSSNPEYFQMESFYSRTIVLRMGDYNLDGYPDLIGVLKTDGKPQQERTTRGVLFENVPCSPSPQNPCHFNRTFSPNFEILKDYKNVVSASFYDIADNGVLDVIMVQQRQNTPLAPQFQKFAVRAFENDMNFDSSFLKVMVLTGQQCLQCESGIPYGTVLPGATVRYSALNGKGREEYGVAAQTYRTSHMPLDLPFEIFGIGHSPNFIGSLEVAVAPNAEEPYRSEWLQIIPNSQVVVVPNPLERPNRWTMKLFLTPSAVVLKTFGILVAICAVFGTFVGILELKDRREDRLVRQSEAHRIIMY